MRKELPTYRAHNEQAMAHAAVAYAKAMRRRRMMACTSSIGPGATNMVTAAAVAHVDRLPVLLLPGDIFANRLPDPVLQQAENFGDGTASVNDCFRPVSRYFDRITRPEQLIPALNRAMAVLTDPADCGPVTLALCQDVQAEAYDYPESFFEERLWIPRRVRPDERELEQAVAALRKAKKPAIIAGGGVLFSEASATLVRLCGATRHSGFRNARRQVVAAVPRSAQYGRGRRHRHECRQRGLQPMPMSSSRSAPGFRISRPVPGRCSRIPTRRSSASTRRSSMPRSIARCRWSPMRESGSKNSPPISGPGRRRMPGRKKAKDGFKAWMKEADAWTAATNADAIGRAGDRRGAARARRATFRCSARRADCRANCTSCGRRPIPRPTISNMAIPAWATRSPAASA